MRVFFTGATGVIGREAVPLLVAAGHEVTGVARGPDKEAWLASVGAVPMAVDLFDPPAVRSAVAGHDVVAHMATAIPPQARMADRSAWTVNDGLRAEVTRYLVDAAIAHAIPRMVLQSIEFIYADGGDRWLTESSPIDPVWDALDSAVVAEGEMRRWGNTGGEAVTLRFGRLYGPGRASSEMVEAVAARKAPILGPGSNYVSSVHIEDVGRAVVESMTVSPGVYNVSDDEPMQSGDIARAMAGMLQVGKPRRVPAWLARIAAGDAARVLTVSHRVSNERFKDLTGWQPAYPSIADGLRSMLA